MQDGIQWCNDPGTNMIKYNMYVCTYYIDIYIYCCWIFQQYIIILTDTSRLFRNSWSPPIFPLKTPPQTNSIQYSWVFFHTLWSFTGYYVGSPPGDAFESHGWPGEPKNQENLMWFPWPSCAFMSRLVGG